MMHRITLRPLGPAGTPLRSDTLFGHACWAMALTEGDDALAAMLATARQGAPELVFSDGFPAGYLPTPLTFTASLATGKPAMSLQERQERKQLKKMRWINRASAEKATWSLETIMGMPDALKDAVPQEMPRLRNSIDRFSGTSLQKNGLFEDRVLWYGGIWETINVYCVSKWPKTRIETLLENVCTCGYGRDTTTGSGVMRLDSVEEDTFPAHADSTHFLSLSRLVPDDSLDLATSYWTSQAKYGKVWQGLGDTNPFKKAILQTVPGSVFRSHEERPVYGTILTDVHTDSRVIENCMTIPYPLPASASNRGSHE